MTDTNTKNVNEEETLQAETTLEENTNESAEDLTANEEADSLEEQVEELVAEENSAESAETKENSSNSAAVDTVSKAKYEEMNSKYLRLHAEFDNFRRRNAKERLDLIETANSQLLGKLADVVDNFDRAFSEEHKSEDLETFHKGILLIKDQFQSVLKEFGLEAIDPQGQPFDPNFQEAFLQQPSEDIEEGNVISVFQKGYKVKEKIIKTAKVIVSSGPAGA